MTETVKPEADKDTDRLVQVPRQTLEELLKEVQDMKRRLEQRRV